MKDKIKLVIFDMDGLMVDTESICIKAWDKVFNNYKIKVEKEGIIKKEGIEELLGYLENKGIKKAVASSSFRTKVNKFLTITGLIDKFDYIVAGDEVKDSKPAPDLYLNVIEKFGIDNQNIIILEDSKNGLTAAKRAGLEKRIYIPDIVILSSEEEKKLTYKKFNSLLEVKKELEENNNFI